jgi:carbohydrate diacid regulator
MSSVYVAMGTVVGDIKDVSRSYKEAKMALEVGKIFYTESHVMAYEKFRNWSFNLSITDALCQDVYSRDFPRTITG